FAAGGTNALFFKVITAGPGATVFNIATDQAVPVANNVNISVTPEPVVVLMDTFSSQTLDDTKWTVDTTPLIEGGTATGDSSVVITNGTLGMFVQCEFADWPGFSVYTKTTFTASAVSPAVFEVDRVKMEYQLVGGDTSK